MNQMEMSTQTSIATITVRNAAPVVTPSASVPSAVALPSVSSVAMCAQLAPALAEAPSWPTRSSMIRASSGVGVGSAFIDGLLDCLTPL